MTELRAMTAGDIPAGLELCRAAGWNQLRRDWEIFLKASPDGCRVAVKDGKVCGTVTTICYEHKFCWIGMVLVDPSQRRQGIGMQLLNEALDILGDEETVKLDATPEGRLLYQQMGFVDEYRLSRMKIHSFSAAYGMDVDQIHEAGLEMVYSYDRPVFGAGRKDLLQWQFSGAREFAFIKKTKGNISGYCLGRKGFNFSHIGPVVADEMSVAKSLIIAALSNSAGVPVIIDIPQSNTKWMEWIRSIGFTEQRPFIRMYRGRNTFPGIPEKQYAICGPEFG